MDHAAVLARYDLETRRNARPDTPGARIERAGAVVRQVAGEQGWNGVVWSGLDATGADRAIAEQIAYFRDLGLDFEWKLYGHDGPADLGERLIAAGFSADEPETLMIGEIADLTLEERLPDGVRLVRAADAAGVDLVVAVHERVFGTDGTALRDHLLARLTAGPGTVHAVVALAGDEPVASARLELV
uniref:GNAT family N-acetyltransferase n=1 Tax=Streptomyces recifensis TaxID=67355 RepID=UPI000A3C5A20